MRSRQLALCAAVAACAVTTAPAPAYGADDRASGTATVQATPVSRGGNTSRGTGGAAGRALVRSMAVYAGAPRSWTGGGLIAGTGAGVGRTRSGSAPGAHPALVAPAAGTGRAGAAAYAAKEAGATRAANATKDPHTPKESKAASSRELSSTSAVGLVLAGGAILVIAGQLLRLRLRLRRERRGDADER